MFGCSHPDRAILTPPAPRLAWPLRRPPPSSTDFPGPGGPCSPVLSFPIKPSSLSHAPRPRPRLTPNSATSEHEQSRRHCPLPPASSGR
uniref:Uncharacterized protein n=1 Tax=Aegilops tauschii subsp. strangulata TaxID=200361 RepID=A0A453ST38_AEGTS